MRDYFSQIITEKGSLDQSFYILSGDHGYALFDSFRKSTPSQFINAGIAEQGMIGLSAGFAKKGLKPLVYGLAAFIPMRVLEFIKMQICYENLPVIIVGDGAGLVYSTLGSSHQCGEDIAVLNPLPNIKIYSPADKFELNSCFKRAENFNGPSYIRLGKCDKPTVHSEYITGNESIFSIVENNIPTQTAVIAHGSMVSSAVEVSKNLPIDVYSMPFLSEIDEIEFDKKFTKYKRIITIEEHSIHGGLGSILLSLANNSNNVFAKIHTIGLKKQFTIFASNYERALEEHGLTITQLNTEIIEIIGITA